MARRRDRAGATGSRARTGAPRRIAGRSVGTARLDKAGPLARRHLVIVQGEPAWRPLALALALLLATWHDLSDVRLAESLDDRESFRRFFGFRPSRGGARARRVRSLPCQRVRHGLGSPLFEMVTQRLDQRGGLSRADFRVVVLILFVTRVEMTCPRHNV